MSRFNIYKAKDENKPLFIPLTAKYYDQYEAGEKSEELRLYGPRWNEKTCQPGRRVILSRGYGKKHRMTGVIWQFKKQRATTFGSTYRAAVMDVFGTLEVDIAVILIIELSEIKP